MTTLTDLQTAVNALPWANTGGAINGTEIQALWNDCIGVFTGLGSGGGSGGTPNANSVTALAASNPALGAVYLTLSGRAGMFVWAAGNFTTAVTNDPAKAITVAWSGDTSPGATGAWVRLVVSPTNFGWFGLVSGAMTDAPTIAANSTALINFAVWARAQSAAGFGLRMIVDRGTYPWDMALTQHWVANIGLMEISGYGSTWQNVTTNSSWFYQWPLDWTGFLGNNSAPSGGRYLINSTTVGSSAITTVTPSDIANLVVGDYVLLTSGDEQYFGYPPNAANFEYPAIASVNQYASASPSSVSYATGTGVLSLTFATAPLGAAVGTTLNGALVTVGSMTATGGTPPNGTWPILSTGSSGTVINLQTTIGLGTLSFTGNGTLAAVGAATLDRPIRWQHLSTYPDNPTNSNPAGAARVSLLKNNGGSGSILWDWNVTHTYAGLKVLECSGQTNGQGYITMAGKHIEWHKSEIPGISPTVIGLCKVAGCKFTVNPLGSQPDKLIDICILEGNDIPGNLQFTGATNVLLATGNTIGGIFNPGAKTNICNGNNIGTLTSGASNGVDRSCVLNGGFVNKFSPTDHFASGSQAFTVGLGGSPPLYANGTFSLPWANLTPVLPGMMLHWGQTSGLYSGDLGSMMVTGIRGDATYLYVDTTCQSAGVPAFANNQVFVRRLQRFTANGVSGCDEIRRLSAACKAGFQEFEYLEEDLIGVTSPSGHAKAVGYPVEFGLNVRQPCGVASKTLTIGMNLNQGSSPTTVEVMTWVIDLTTVGKRKINQTTGAAVLLGADTLTFNGSAATAFPAGWFLNNNAWPSWSLNYTPSALTSLQLPWVEMRFQFDPGMYFTVPTAQVDQALLNTMLGLMGSPP